MASYCSSSDLAFSMTSLRSVLISFAVLVKMPLAGSLNSALKTLICLWVDKSLKAAIPSIASMNSLGSSSGYPANVGSIVPISSSLSSDSVSISETGSELLAVDGYELEGARDLRGGALLSTILGSLVGWFLGIGVTGLSRSRKTLGGNLSR